MILINKGVFFYQEINQRQCIAKQNKLKQRQCTPTIFLYNPTFTFSPSFETAGPSHCWLPVVIDNKGKIMAKNVQHPHGFEVTDVQEKPIAARVEPSGVLSVFPTLQEASTLLLTVREHELHRRN